MGTAAEVDGRKKRMPSGRAFQTEGRVSVSCGDGEVMLVVNWDLHGCMSLSRHER